MAASTNAATIPPHATAALVLADGKIFFGQGVGFKGTTLGELCFNTALTGYQETLTDPSYCGQIITFTFPHIGNIGTNDEDIETKLPFAAGLVIREPITEPSSFRANRHFNDWLVKHKLTGISGVDTRALTRYLRINGAQNGALCYFGEEKKGFDPEALRAKLAAHPNMNGLELAGKVTTKASYTWDQTVWKLGKSYGTQKKPRFKVVAVDYGAKHNILRCLAEVGCDVTVVPAGAKAVEIQALNPDGVFLSNGPGDPAATGVYALPEIKALLEARIPVFGICLGHQLLGLALGCSTEKMSKGHRGSNQPVKDLQTGHVEITSQNHGFMVSEKNLPKDVEITHRSLFDGTVEGIRSTTYPAFSVQHHPESSPGPHDSFYLFERFVELMEQQQKGGKKRHA